MLLALTRYKAMINMRFLLIMLSRTSKGVFVLCEIVYYSDTVILK